MFTVTPPYVTPSSPDEAWNTYVGGPWTVQDFLDDVGDVITYVETAFSCASLTDAQRQEVAGLLQAHIDRAIAQHS